MTLDSTSGNHYIRLCNHHNGIGPESGGLFNCVILVHTGHFCLNTLPLGLGDLAEPLGNQYFWRGVDFVLNEVGPPGFHRTRSQTGPPTL